MAITTMINDDHEAEYIDAATAGEILGVSPRQAMRYGAGDNAPVRTSRVGRRVLFHAGDVRTLRDDLEQQRHAPRTPRAEMMPAGDVFDYLRERDRRIEELEKQLAAAMLEIGRLQGAQEAVKLLRDELATLRSDQPKEQRPWWKRLLGN